jgi:hypothetical protein
MAQRISHYRRMCPKTNYPRKSASSAASAPKSESAAVIGSGPLSATMGPYQIISRLRHTGIHGAYIALTGTAADRITYTFENPPVIVRFGPPGTNTPTRHRKGVHMNRTTRTASLLLAFVLVLTTIIGVGTAVPSASAADLRQEQPTPPPAEEPEQPPQPEPTEPPQPEPTEPPQPEPTEPPQPEPTEPPE